MTILERVYLRKLSEVFGANDAEIVATWVRNLGDNRPVVIVGAGFSRNAPQGSSVPVWSDVIRALETSSGIEHGLYNDPLTLAEYAWEEDENSFIHTLRSLMPDHELRPGDAHTALFDYPVAAVITTNQLDTLLDKQRSWHKVVNEHDLGLCNDTPPLIYFHGHRDDPETWVFTRTQFEELPSKHPIINAKVRQLLAQHPALILGYSLSDPDFHNLYRQVAVDMGRLQPRGLVLTLSRPPAVEQRHWEKMGLRIVTIKKGEDGYDAQFARFLRLRPQSDAPFATREDLLTGLDSVRDLSERVSLLVEVFADSNYRNDYIKPHGWFALWKAVVRKEFSSEVWGELQPDKSDNIESRGVGVASKLKILPSDRFSLSPQHSWVRVVDRLLETTGHDRDNESFVAIGRWLLLAVELVPLSQERLRGIDLKEMLDLAAWVWSRAGSSCDYWRPSDRVVDEARASLKKCFEVAVRYDYGYMQGGGGASSDGVDFAEDFAVLGLEHDPEGPPLDAYTESMRSAFSAWLDRDWRTAATLYADAREVASGIDEFREWLALEGLNYALRNCVSKPPTENEVSRVWDTLERIKRCRQVRDWLRFADERLRNLDRLRIRELSEQLQSPVFGETIRFNNIRYAAWRSFRDLETLWAPPFLQARYVEPFLQGEDLVGEEILRYRLRLSSANTGKWLWGRLSSLSPEGQRRELQSSSFVDVVLDASLREKNCVRNRLDIFERVSSLFCPQHASGATKVLEEARGKLSHVGDLHALVKASLCFSRTFDYPSAEVVLERLYAKSVSGYEWGVWVGQISRGSWSRWGYTNAEASEALLWRLIERAEGNVEVGKVEGAVVRSMCKWLHSAGGAALSELGRAKVVRVISSSTVPETGDCWADVERGRLLIQMMIGDLESRKTALYGLERRCMEQIRVSREAQGERDFKLTPFLWATSCMGDIAEVRGEWTDEMTAWWVWFEEVRESVLASCEMNVHLQFGAIVGRTLAHLIPLAAQPERVKIAARVIEVLGTGPGVLGSLPRQVLEPRHWGGQWKELIARVTLFAAGDWRRNAGQVRLSLLSSLHEMHRGPRSQGDVPHPELIRPLREMAYLFAGHRDQCIAAAAVASLMRLAIASESESDERLRTLILKVADDPRIQIRENMAYFLGRISICNGSGPYAELASELSSRLAGEPYLVLQNARTLALAEPPYFPSLRERFLAGD